LSVFEPEAGACFYDFFESGANQWERDSDWEIVALPEGGRAMTDSPTGNYRSASPPASTHTTSITSAEFSLDDCQNPALSFRHDYVLAQLGSSQDVGRVKISTDGGATWTELKRYSGGGIYSPGGANIRAEAGTRSNGDDGSESSTPVGQNAESAEWANVDLKAELIRLGAYTGTVRLRFSLEVDEYVSDRGWVIDDVVVK